MKGLTSRIAAWEVLQAVAAGSFADVALDRVLSRHDLKAIDKALVTEIAYGAIRHRFFLDCWIDHLGKMPALKQPPLLRWLLHLGLYQILKMQKIPAAAAINTTVEIAKLSKLSKLAPVVNALLRSALRYKENGNLLPIPSDRSAQIAQAASLPMWIVDKLISCFGINKAIQIGNAFNRSQSIDLRVNLLKSNLEEVRKEFDFCAIKTELIDNCPQGLEVLSSYGELSKWPGYDDGHWSVQDRSSQLVATFLEPKPGENILDACAAPGGKATHIAELIRNEGEVWALDRSSNRVNRLIKNSKRLNSNCIKPLIVDALSFLDKYPECKNFFHRILLDAPCSGLGTLARHPDARWRMSEEKIKDLVGLQKQLLQAMTPLLKQGGRLIYSTCTITPEENHLQIEQFIREYPQFHLSYQQQILPGEGDGFYIAVLDFL